MSQYLELAKKLKKLAESGVGGEKYNAQMALDRVMKSHHIQPEELEEDKLDFYFFEFKDWRFFIQIVISISGVKTRVSRYRTRLGKKINRCEVELTKLQSVELEIKHDYFWKAYQDELEIFFSAFIQKNRLFDDNLEPTPIEALTTEQLEKIYKIQRMAEGVERKPYLKAIKE